MDLIMKIRNIKCIENLDFTFPLNKGIYAITGENGAGKSTLERVHIKTASKIIAR